MEEVWISTPRSPSAVGALDCISAAAALSHRKVPIRLMCTILVKNSPAIGPLLPSIRPAPTTPAQFTSRFRPARCACAASMAVLTSVSEVTSQRMNAAPDPSAAAAARPGPSCTSSSTTLPPAPTRWRATASPSPEAPPVMTARASLIFIVAPGCVVRTASSRNLDRERHRFTAADAQRGDPASPTAAAQRMDQGGENARAGRPDRVTEGAGAAVHVDPRMIDVDVAHRRHGDDGEGLVDLVQVRIVRPPIELREHLA